MHRHWPLFLFRGVFTENDRNAQPRGYARVLAQLQLCARENDPQAAMRMGLSSWPWKVRLVEGITR